MSNSTTVQPQYESVVDQRTSLPRLALPPEVAATLLALSTVALGAFLNLPTYGIFLGWAAAGLAAGNTGARIPVLGRCLVIGALFGAATLAGQLALEQLLGSAVPGWVCLVVVLAVANPLMIVLGRIPAFDSVPGMFIGFSTLLAVHLGGAAPISDSILGALVVSASMNLIGLGFYWLHNRLTGRRAVEPDSGAPTRTHAGAVLEPKLRA